ncbi:hypothetical protein CUR178_02071 [Leishmania enriettii]|uniref:Uncharacterized protein n=1 Tax=Leishmania enriettii TaxID=5663 RepID=A0A836GD38_LEIEN|nr:hypothetical protein CUR178_02068 [Leishmania enriettii]KAG5469927.1 hypothetical protein CUR178_02069 [Leishmania enriettii]KAG5469928.1 hypothetical protein CUR178_02070 [Leishmania enriettii]KAG5469929.1 hypothetical protein CUR178_02071 [Leishmania enriettii]
MREWQRAYIELIDFARTVREAGRLTVDCSRHVAARLYGRLGGGCGGVGTHYATCGDGHWHGTWTRRQ